jgi:uncharacterized iron-regulated membrane protein
MGPLFWWNFWNVVAVLVVVGIVAGITVWVRRRLAAQQRMAAPSADPDASARRDGD